MIQALVDAANPGDLITLADGVYDDLNPVVIRKDITIVGSRNAIVHSEMQILSGVNVHLIGFTWEMNKVGAPSHNGYNAVPSYPQNGLCVIINSSLWCDDMDVRWASGGSTTKTAFHAFRSGIHFRTQTQFSRIDWRGCPAPIMEVFYGSYVNIFDNTGVQGLNLLSGSSSKAIYLVGGDAVMSGAHLYNYGTGPVGVGVHRDGYFQFGAGFPTSIQGFQTPIQLDGTTSRQWTAPQAWTA